MGRAGEVVVGKWIKLYLNISKKKGIKNLCNEFISKSVIVPKSVLDTK